MKEYEELQEGFSEQYNCPCVLVEAPITSAQDAEDIISFARHIVAECFWECEPDEEPDLVINFLKGKWSIRGPEVFTEQAVRATVVDALKEQMV